MNAEPDLRPPDTRDWVATVVHLVIYITALIVAFGLGVWWIVALTIVGGLAWLVHWHARTYGYRCPSCHATFTISDLADLFSPQTLDKRGQKYLRCPTCGRRTWMPILRRSRAS